MVEKIEWNGKVFALILRKDFEAEGVNFITPKDNPFQLGVLKHPRGAEVRAHVHKSSLKKINSIQEVLHIEYGEVEVDFYNDVGEKVNSSQLSAGDTILLISGGHGFKVLEDSKIIEVKQGPYYGLEEDKEYLDVDQEGNTI